MEQWLSHGSLLLIVAALLVAGLGVPIPEDPVLLAAGVLAHTRSIPLALVIVVCAVAVLAADFAVSVAVVAWVVFTRRGRRRIDAPQDVPRS